MATVIIPHHNDKDRLTLCLESLNRCSGRAKVEIIVVDNGLPRLGTSFVTRHPDICFLYEPEAGAAHARNTGVRHAKGPTLIFTDSDCQVALNFLIQALKASEAHDVTGGKVQLTSHGSEQPNGIQAFEHVFAFNQRRYIEEKSFSVTANLVTNVKVFKRVGPFHVGVSEDYDWGQRAAALGHEIAYQPVLIVSHPCRSTWGQLRSKWKRITAETYGIHRSRGKPTALWVTRALMMPFSIAVHAPRVIYSTALTTPRARIGAMIILVRLRLWRMTEMIRLAMPHDPAQTD